MNNYKILTQKKWFSNNENVEDEFGNRINWMSFR